MLYHEVFPQAFCPIRSQSLLHRRTMTPVIMWIMETLQHLDVAQLLRALGWRRTCCQALGCPERSSVLC